MNVLVSLTWPFGVRTYQSTIENTCSTYLDKFMMKDSLICKHDTLFKVACLPHTISKHFPFIIGVFSFTTFDQRETSNHQISRSNP